MIRSRAFFLALMFGFGTMVAHAQSISGYTSLDIDPSSGTVTATCETDVDPYTDGYYEASTRCFVKDGTGAVIASDQNTDLDGAFGYAQVILTFAGVPGTTYTATGTHYGVVSVPYDLPDTRPGQNFYQYDDYYNFSSLTQGTPQIYTGAYTWYGLGPDTATRTTVLKIGNTTDTLTVPRVPDHLSVVSDVVSTNIPCQYGTTTLRVVQYSILDKFQIPITSPVSIQETVYPPNISSCNNLPNASTYTCTPVPSGVDRFTDVLYPACPATPQLAQTGCGLTIPNQVWQWCPATSYPVQIGDIGTIIELNTGISLGGNTTGYAPGTIFH